MNNQCFEMEFSSELTIGQAALSKAMAFVSDNLFLNNEEYYDIKLILSELVFNAIIHGNNGDSNKKTRIKIDLSKDGIQAMISDEGRGFNLGDVLRTVESDVNNFSENGRGLKLAMKLSDSFSINKNGREILFSKKVGLKHV
ncbi:MAG: ATP-binding protein [Clostridiales bacterium]|nr:ATP-binding protein [Clostridiales bacterium]